MKHIVENHIPAPAKALDGEVQDLIEGIVRALPDMVLRSSPRADARFRAAEFARAFAARRAA